MNKMPMLAAAAALAVMVSPAFAETSSDRTLKAPEKSMGDEGKLPATERLGERIPDMTGPRTAATPSTSEPGASGPKGPPKRMGDQGTLPATNKMGNRVPEMNGNGSR
jgi:hypothetical protein